MENSRFLYIQKRKRREPLHKSFLPGHDVSGFWSRDFGVVVVPLMTDVATLYRCGNYGKGLFNRSLPHGVTEALLASKRSRGGAPMPAPSMEHQAARRRLSQSTSLHSAWHRPVGEQELCERQHSTTFCVHGWSPASRLQRAHYTATVDKRAGNAEAAEWTPATAGRAAVAAAHHTPQAVDDPSAALLQERLSRLQVPRWAVPAEVAELLARDPLVLTAEEAAWLALECKVLHVYSDRAAWCKHACGGVSSGALTAQQLRRAMCQDDSADRIWLYAWLRRKNWVVRSGVAFAGEYVLYPDGPAAGHAVYSLALARAPGWTPSWRQVMGRLRVASTVSKQLLLADVHTQPHAVASHAARPSDEEEDRSTSSDTSASNAAGPATQAERTLHTVLFRGVRLDSEAGLKSRHHIRSIVSQWAAPLRGKSGSTAAAAAAAGSGHSTRIAVFDCTSWSGEVAPSQHVEQFHVDHQHSPWFQSAANWIGR